MGRTVPETQQDAIDFFAGRIGAWSDAPTLIGLTEAQSDAVAAALSEAQAALAAARAARIAARTATLALNQAMATLRSTGGDAVKTIRAFAEATDNPAVYTDASIPPASPPSPAGIPDAPTRVEAAITSRGAAAIRWKGSRAGGTAFIVERRLKSLDGVAGPWAYAGTSTTNTLTDATIPIGHAAVTYRVFAIRPAGRGPATTANPIAFGTEAGTAPPIRLAS